MHYQVLFSSAYLHMYHQLHKFPQLEQDQTKLVSETKKHNIKTKYFDHAVTRTLSKIKSLLPAQRSYLQKKQAAALSTPTLY
jgi:hypothetical protein